MPRLFLEKNYGKGKNNYEERSRRDEERKKNFSLLHTARFLLQNFFFFLHIFASFLMRDSSQKFGSF